MGGKRILLIIPEMTMGGAQRSLSKLSLAFAKDHHVWLVIFNKLDQIAYPYGGELLTLDVVPGPSAFNKVTSFNQRVWRLKALKRKLKIDVAISFLEGADYINVLSRRGEKIILSIRGSKRHDERMMGNFFWLRNNVLIPWLYKRADIIVTVNHGIAEELHFHYGLKDVKTITIGNFYNINEIASLALEKRDENLERFYKDPVLVTSGRLASEKGLEQLLQVFAALRKQGNLVRLILVGDGPDYHKLNTLARRLGLDVYTGFDFSGVPQVLFVREQRNVFKFLRDSSIYLMNSSSEGFPNGLAEAMICGVPVVSSDCPYGPREILEPDYPVDLPMPKPHMSPCGVLMPIIETQEDVRLWTKTLQDLLVSKEALLRLSKNAKERIIYFDEESIISQWHALVE